MEELQEPDYHGQDNVQVFCHQATAPVRQYARTWNDLMLMLMLATPCVDRSATFGLKIQHVKNHHVVCF